METNEFFPHFTKSHLNQQKSDSIHEDSVAHTLLTLAQQASELNTIACKWLKCSQKVKDFDQLVHHVTSDHISPEDIGRRILLSKYRP